MTDQVPQSVRPVKRQALQVRRIILSNVRMMRTRKPVMLQQTRGDRLRHAVDEEGTSLQKVEAAVGFSKGFLSRYCRGERGGTLVDVDKMGALADLLHVRIEWLLYGRGPMRREGRGTTPAEEALVACRRWGVREEAIQSAWGRFQDRVDRMSAAEWVTAIWAEDAVLARAAAERVEAIEAPLPPTRPCDAARSPSENKSNAPTARKYARCGEILSRGNA
jgi:transcriptional regulator with XRE-family HTH domain